VRKLEIDWTPEMDALLGTKTDRKIAVDLGLPRRRVGQRRRELGILPIRYLKWTPEMDALLGTMVDQDVADELGIERSTAFYRREELGIASFGRQGAEIKWAPEMETLLGTKKDLDIAEELGLCQKAVWWRRQELGIPSLKEQNRVLPEGVLCWSGEARQIYRARRRHLREGVLNTLTYEQWKYACEWFDNRCAYCEEKAFLTEDHLRPLSDGGPRTALNIIPACGSCNSSKGPKQAHLWIYEHFGMTKGKEIVEKIVAYLTEVKG